MTDDTTTDNTMTVVLFAVDTKKKLTEECAIATNMAVDDTATDCLTADKTVFDSTLHNDTVADETTKDVTVGNDTTDDTVRNDTTEDDTVGNDTTADDTVRNDTTADDTIANNMTADDTNTNIPYTDLFQIMAWNIQGLASKLRSPSWKAFCEKFKIFAFCEVWSCRQCDIESVFPDYTVFFSPRTQRQKGGVAVCVHKTIAPYVEQVCESAEDNVFLKIGKTVFNCSTDILAGFVYVAPERSVIYGEDNCDGIETLENHMSQILNTYPDLPWLLCGDFNARTSGLSDVDSTDDNRHVPLFQDLDELIEEAPLNSRKTKDNGSNNFGKKLIELCKEFGLFIVNGRTKSDYEGEITCTANRGKSVVDYFICSLPLYQLITDMFVADRTESDHFPIVVSFPSRMADFVPEDDYEMHLEDELRYTWKEQCSESFDAYCHENAQVEYEKFMSALDNSVEEACDSYITFIHNAAEKMRSKQKKRDSRPQPPWWDAECEQIKQDKYSQLKVFRHTNSHEDLQSYIDIKKKFKNMCKQKQLEHNEKVLKELNDSCNDTNSKAFWQKLKSLTTNRQRTTHDIPPRSWYEHFKSLFCTHQASDDSGFAEVVQDTLDAHNLNDCENCANAQLDDDITEAEILGALRKLKKGKAPGPDGLSSDFFQHAMDVHIKFLVPLFNKIFSTGDYPGSWSNAVLFPLHKKGSTKRADNYRGISLLNIVSKLYSSVINERLSQFCEENDSIPESQAGFRKGYSTIDNIFTLQCLVQKYLTKQGGRFYTLFVDFSKAFDCVDRMKLLFVMLRKGVHGKMFQTLQSMYKSVKTAVKVGNKITDYFDCLSGVKQGCILSPLLFSMFLSELEVELNSCGARGIDTFNDPLGIFLLMYADDIALVSDSIADLQKKINCLEQYCAKWGLTVNMDKTKVVVFKNGGFLKSSERWYYAGKQIIVESSYNYLGVIFGSTLNWSRCAENLSSKALRAVAGIKKLYFRLKNLPADTVFKIFDAKVKPILLYGSEIWGSQKFDDIERVHIKICKMILCVGKDVKNNIALGECGRFPIYIDALVRMIKYWNRLLTMPDGRYPKQCYKMLLKHDLAGRKNWVTHLRILLCTHGFGYVWEMQATIDTASFIKTFKNRLLDSFRQDWHDSLSSESEYLDYHPEILRANYIGLLASFEHRRAVCLLRCSKLPLNGISRFGKPILYPYCDQCGGHQIEDLCHFLLVCPRYASLRKKLIPVYYYRFPTNFKVHLLCLNLSDNMLFKLGMYVSESLKIRNAQ